MKQRQIKINWNKFNDIVYDDSKHLYTLNNEKLISCTQFLNKFKVNIFNENFIKEYCDKHGYEIDYIKKLWNIKKELGTTKGSEIHWSIESKLRYNQEFQVSKNSEIEYEYFLNFLKDHEELEFVKSEFIVYDKDLGIAGTIDCIFKNKNTGKYLIVDWKTNKAISNYNQTRMKNPVSNLFQTDINIYSLQLGIYRYILEKNLPINISDLWLVHFNRNVSDNYVKYELDYLKEDIEKMLKIS